MAAGGAMHLTRLLGRDRALEAIFPSDDHDADVAERYGWINRLLPATVPDAFVASFSHRIAKFPADGYLAITERTNTMVDRTETCFNLNPKRLVADTTYGSHTFLNCEWLVPQI